MTILGLTDTENLTNELLDNESSSTQQPIIVIFGHVCIDENIIEGVSYKSWGSPAMYIAAYFAQKYSIKSHLVSYYGDDFTEYISDFTLMAIPPSRDATLIYKNIVKNGRRTQYCLNTKNSEHVPLNNNLIRLIAKADILIVAPNIPNYSVEYIKRIVGYTQLNCKKVLLAQGLLRKVENTFVSRRALEDPLILASFDAVILSDEDVDNALGTVEQWSTSAVRTSFIVTRAEHSAVLFHERKFISIPTRPISKKDITNSIGAGDIFSAEVAMQLFMGASIEQSIRSAHTSTAKVLTARAQYK